MNAHSLEMVGRFIDLRAQGWTFEKIAAELNVGRRTLVRWSRQSHPFQMALFIQMAPSACSENVNAITCI